MTTELTLTEVLGWGSMDITFLNDRINEFNLDSDDIIQNIEDMGMDKTDINSWIYSCFYLGATNFLNEVEEYAEDTQIEFNRDDIEIEVFCNYLDSSLNGEVLNSDIDIMDYSELNLANFIEMVKGN